MGELEIEEYFLKRLRYWKAQRGETEYNLTWASKSELQDKWSLDQHNMFTRSLHLLFDAGLLDTNSVDNWQPRCYEELLDLPCIILLSGRERTGETFPRWASYNQILCYIITVKCFVFLWNHYSTLVPLPPTLLPLPTSPFAKSKNLIEQNIVLESRCCIFSQLYKTSTCMSVCFCVVVAALHRVFIVQWNG